MESTHDLKEPLWESTTIEKAKKLTEGTEGTEGMIWWRPKLPETDDTTNVGLALIRVW